MRILHTSDWHLGAMYRGFDRTGELFDQVRRVCRICEEQEVDVLLVAGDIFERLQRQRLHDVTKDLCGILAPFIRKGLRVVMVPGNHDYRDHFRLMKSLLELEQGCAGRVCVAQGCDIFEIDGVQFAVVPYPERELLERAGEKTSTANKTGAGERNQALSVILSDVVREVAERLDPAKPSVFVTHIQVYGVKTPSERELTYRDDICLSHESLPVNVSYIALGHIHQAQQIAHVVPCWFSGSFDRMDLGERDDEKCVLIVDVTGPGPAGVTRHPIEMTPFIEISTSSDDLEGLAAGFAERERAYVRLNVDCGAAANQLEIHRRARELFPRCVEFNLVGQRLTPAAAYTPSSPADYKRTVMEHLEKHFEGDAELPELKACAEALIQEVSDALAAN